MNATATDPRFAYRKDGALKHSTQCGMAFGKLDPTHCARCEERGHERADGIDARSHAGFDSLRRRQNEDTQRAAEIREHFNSVKHRSGGCGTVCTFGDW